MVFLYEHKHIGRLSYLHQCTSKIIRLSCYSENALFTQNHLKNTSSTKFGTRKNCQGSKKIIQVFTKKVYIGPSSNFFLYSIAKSQDLPQIHDPTIHVICFRTINDTSSKYKTGYTSGKSCSTLLTLNNRQRLYFLDKIANVENHFSFMLCLLYRIPLMRFFSDTYYIFLQN